MCPANSVFSLEPGSTLRGRFRLVRPLHRGQSASIYLASDLQTATRVAIKLVALDPTRIVSPTSALHRLVTVLSGVQSPYLLANLASGFIESGEPFIVTEMLSGIDLAAELGNRQKLPFCDACDYLRQACWGLSKCHNENVFHLALKPSNIFLQDDRQTRLVKVLDLAVIGAIQPDGTSVFVLPSLPQLEYMSPEQLVPTTALDARADVWSLGAILYECLVGEPPFAGQTVDQRSHSIHVTGLTPAKNLCPEIPIELSNLLTKALALNPNDRFANAGELAVALGPFTIMSDLGATLDISAKTLPAAQISLQSHSSSHSRSVEETLVALSGHDHRFPPDSTSVQVVRTPVQGLARVDRFVLESKVGQGGMGVVYRGVDINTGQPAAIKLLHQDSHSHHLERLRREAEALAELDHPSIVRYLGHGLTDDNVFYLAMEWLDGCDLEHYLQDNKHLSIEAALKLAMNIADPLGYVHAKGLVHRDIKPSNVFLVNKDPAFVKILDFGLVRGVDGSRGATRTGTILGTPAYMAPEQARGAKQIDSRADVFALGCVLFECLVGNPPFMGDQPFAILAKILFEDSPHLLNFRPDASGELDELLSQMLSKQPEERPSDGGQVLSLLQSVQIRTFHQRSTSLFPVSSLTHHEKRLLSVLLLDFENDEPDSEKSVQSKRQIVSHIVESYQGKAELLASGVMIVTLTANRAAIDQAFKAARCALEIRTVLPDSCIVLCMGRGLIEKATPVGDVIDRAAALFEQHRRTAAAVGDTVSSPIWLDDVSAGFLRERFAVEQQSGRYWLAKERANVEGARTLLGKKTSCVGRELELATLIGLFDECVAESSARVALLLADAGVGKTRLQLEFLKRLKDREEPIELWVGRGEEFHMGSPFGLLAAPIRAEAGVLDGEPVTLRRQKLRSRVARSVEARETVRVAEFLGEMIGIPYSEAESQQLRSARHDPLLMGDQMRRAWEDFVASECKEHPVVLVLEDLHWGDLPSIQFVDSALRTLTDVPFFVLGTARPSVFERFPSLWEGRGIQQFALKPLSVASCKKLIREVLGTKLRDEEVMRLITLAEGNAFFLEELMRATAEGREGQLPGTILAMVQARLDALDADSRKVLRAASVFGKVTWSGGVCELLGGDASMAAEKLNYLIDEELLSAHTKGRFPDQVEYVFRHALVRDCAYEMLTADDKTLGHQLAGEWLERVGETHSLVLAEHFERGGVFAKAAIHYLRAAQQALAGNDLAAALQLVQQSERFGGSDTDKGTLKLIEAEANSWRGNLVEAENAAVLALSLLPGGGTLWFIAAGELAIASGRKANDIQLAAIAKEVLEKKAEPDALGAQVIASAKIAVRLVFAGQYESAKKLIDSLETLTPQLVNPAPSVLAWQHRARGLFAVTANGDFSDFLAEMESSASYFTQAGDLREACNQRGNVGYAKCVFGLYAEAEIELREVLATADRLGLATVTGGAKHNLGFVLERQHKTDEALVLETESLQIALSQQDQRFEAASRIYLSMIYAAKGDQQAAKEQAQKAVEVTQDPPLKAFAMGQLSAVLLGEDSDQSLEIAKQSMTILDELGSVEDGEYIIQLAYAQALLSKGNDSQAKGVLLRARAKLFDTASRISNKAWQSSFLTNVPENARILELCASMEDQSEALLSVAGGAPITSALMGTSSPACTLWAPEESSSDTSSV